MSAPGDRTHMLSKEGDPFQEPTTSACVKRGTKGLRRPPTGRLVGVGGAQGGAGLPLAAGQGMASMFEPAGRVAQPPALDEHRRAVTQQA